jgi:hypothetical protein
LRKLIDKIPDKLHAQIMTAGGYLLVAATGGLIGVGCEVLGLIDKLLEVFGH